ncbi:MAG: hypothetical protein M1818_000604 [Claussenomyces sp. TS43310]|nr:MAG: hypothetical protein M1818_000604 [Claussenomyces sp. TS43310]
MAAEASVRISLRWVADPPAETQDVLALNVGDYFVDLRYSLKEKTIEWAMAGERLILSEEPYKCRWTRVIDSLGEYGFDEGIFTKLPNGDDLETGEMASPDHGGAVTKYEEVWRTGPLASIKKGGCVLQSVADGGKTFLGLVGGYYLALRERDDQPFAAAREDWNKTKEAWEKTYRSGAVDDIPSAAALEETVFQAKVGQVITLDGLEFTVRAIQSQ